MRIVDHGGGGMTALLIATAIALLAFAGYAFRRVIRDRTHSYYGRR